MNRSPFASLAESTREDWEPIKTDWTPYLQDLPNRVIAHLELLEHDHGGFPVSRLEHCLQTATRAQRDGRDDEYVVCALLHDIGDTLAPANHAELAAALLKPYVSEQNHWMVLQHGLFQGIYHFEHWDMDPNARDKFRGHRWFDHTAEFCARYDQVSFAQDYDSLPLEAFESILGRVLSVDALIKRAAA